jgi:hypothetical protein
MTGVIRPTVSQVETLKDYKRYSLSSRCCEFPEIAKVKYSSLITGRYLSLALDLSSLYELYYLCITDI